jgi:flagellar motor switch protein FliG
LRVVEVAAGQQAKTPAPKGIGGPDKVAAILLTMGKPLASRLMKYFQPDEIKLITRSVADLPPVAAPELKALIEDFANQFAAGANLVGTASEVERLLSGVLPADQISEIMGDILGNADRSIWERISSVNESTLAGYVMKEHPQIAALILSRVKSSTAARVIGHLPSDRRDGIIRRMLTIRPIVDETMRQLERTLHQEFTMNAARNNQDDGQARLAEIINKLSRAQMEQVLENLAAVRPQEAEKLKNMLFTFEDIAKLSPKARGTLLEKVPNDKIVLALKGTDQAFREVMLQAMSGRVRKMIDQELNNGQPVAQREVTEARRTITDMALDLAGRGEIEINRGADEEEAYIT